MTTLADTACGANANDLMGTYVQQWALLRKALRKNVGSIDLADEAMQETWIRLAKMQPASMIIHDRKTYILRLAINIAIDLIRKEKRHSSRCISDEALMQAIADTYPSPEQFTADRDQLRQLASALAQLPEKTCAALLMSRCDGLTHAEIAKRLDIGERTVAKYLVTALCHCRDYFSSFE